MHLLYAFFILLIGASALKKDPYLLIFTNDGSFYRLNSNNYVPWRSTLSFDLISLDFPQNNTIHSDDSYLIPTLDGNFIYAHRNREILIERQEVEILLHLCLDSNPILLSNDNLISSTKYFLYEQNQYFLIDLDNGEITEVETFLKKNLSLERKNYSILKISKKFIKQLQEGKVKWSVLSSLLDLSLASDFFKNPNISSKENNKLLEFSNIKIQRISNKEVIIKNKLTNTITEVENKSPVLAVFEEFSEKGFLSHSVEFEKKSILALENKGKSKSTEIKRIEAEEQNRKEHSFPHSSEFISEEEDKNNSLESCLSTFRNINAAIELNRNSFLELEAYIQQTPFSQLKNQTFNEIYTPTKDQPYIWVFIIAVTLGGCFILYKVRINSLLTELSKRENSTEIKFSELNKKLGEFEKLQLMYEIYWNKLVYTSKNKTENLFYEYLIFEGRFLNKETFVYAIRQDSADVVSIEHNLNFLLNYSAHNLSKLFYYTRSSEYLLIFTEKGTLLSELNERNLADMTNNNRKMIMAETLEVLNYIDSQIKLECLPFSCFMIEKYSCLDKKTSKMEELIKIRVNIVPALLRRPQYESDEESNEELCDSTKELRLNIINMFYFITSQGKNFDIDRFKEEEFEDHFLHEFYSFILFEGLNGNEDNNSIFSRKGSERGENLSARKTEILEGALNHPYLWDSNRKIRFLSDFSNYLETCVDEAKGRKLEIYARDFSVIKVPWMNEFPPILSSEINKFRKYDTYSFKDLLRAIRNKLNHFHELPKEIKNVIGKNPEAFVEFALTLFPKLLQFAYVYSRKKKWKLHAT